MKTLALIIMLLFPLAGQAQSDPFTREKDQIGEGKGFIIFGTFLATAPVAVSNSIETPTLPLFAVGCTSVLLGLIMHHVGKKNEYRRLQATPGAISYRF